MEEPAAGERDTRAAEGTEGVEPTLRDLLATPTLRLRVAVAQEDGLDHRVRWAQATELPDPSPYLRGGELVCSVGTTLTTPQRCADFVRVLAAAGVAGLCFGLGDVHEEVPTALREACERYGVPLLLAPLGAPFSAISEYLAGRRLEAETAATRTAEMLVSQLLSGLRARASVSDLLESAAPVMGGRLELRVAGQPVAAAGPALDAEPGAPAPSTQQLEAGELAWWGGGDAPSRRLLDQLARVVEVALREHDVEAALRRERVGQLLLLVGDRMLDPVALVPQLEEAGLGVDSLVVSAWPGGAAPLLLSRLRPALVGEAPGITLAVTSSAGEVAPTAAALTVPCGYGSALPLGRLSQGISQARAALELAATHGGAMGPEGLTTLEGLLEQQPRGRLEPFVDQLMAPLVASDRGHGTHHVDTLRAFLRHDGSLQQTAREQYLHVNTVRHRLARVHELTGRNPLVFADRVALAIALWTLDRRTSSASRVP